MPVNLSIKKSLIRWSNGCVNAPSGITGLPGPDEAFGS